jgi:hypothetical protein
LANNDAQLGQPGYDLAGSNIDRHTSDANANLAISPASGFPAPNTVITSATDTPAGSGLPHRCVVLGYVNQHISPVDQCQCENRYRV